MKQEGKSSGIISIPVYNMAGEVLEEFVLDRSRLGGYIRKDLLHQAVVTYEANRRSGTAKAKTRGEVAYSGAKPWPQKGTGRARAGSRGSPVWVGGGVSHGPKVRDYSKKLSKKMKKLALASALLGKVGDGEVKLIRSIEVDPPKTKEVVRMLTGMGVERSFMVILPEHDPLLWRCTRNISGASMMAVRELNAYSLLKSLDLIFQLDAFEEALERLSGVASPEAESMEVG